MDEFERLESVEDSLEAGEALLEGAASVVADVRESLCSMDDFVV